MLYKIELGLRDIHWIAGRPSNETVELAVRYHADLVPGVILNEVKDLRIKLGIPAWAPAPGQSAVLYQGEECLGGGFIAED
jgi:tRNA-specific 2-thiouridylase